LISRPPGYLARITIEDLDLGRFQRLIDEGKQFMSEGSHDVASTKFREALALWQGPALRPYTEEFNGVAVVKIDDRISGAIASISEWRNFTRWATH
jgi:hypothetical protein